MVMKKVSLLLVLMFAAINLVSAQEWGKSTKEGRNTTFTRNGFWDNWFIGAGAGAAVYFGPSDQHASLTDRMTINPQLFVGKWFNPYLGIRGTGTGGSIHTFRGPNAEKMYTNRYANAHVDFMFNVTNYLMKYNESRVYNFIPTVGAGYIHRFEDGFKKRGFNGPSFNASLLNTFRFTDRLSAYVEVGGFLVERRFDAGNAPKPGDHGCNWNGIAEAHAGLILKVGKVGFQEAVLMDQGLIDDLNSQINRLRQENARLSQRPESCPKCPEAATVVKEVVKDASVSNVVFFRLNSAVIDRHQEVSIFNTAKYLQDNPSAKVKVVGYADKKTGTPAYNEKLSEKRAKNVANALINKYNINSNRVVVEWKGDTVQPYAENEWNRVAIFVVE